MNFYTTPLFLILYTTTFLTVLFGIGELVQRLLQSLGWGFHRKSDAPQQLSTNLFLGAVTLALAIRLVSPFKTFGGPASLLLLAASIAGVGLFLLKPPIKPPSLPSKWSLLVLVAFASALGLRLAFIVGLNAPPFDDPKYHVLLTQMIIDRGGAYHEFGAYAPPGYDTSISTYPQGFHSLAAFFSLLLGFPAIDSVSIATQIFNALIGLATYSLALRILGSRPQAFVAFLLSSFIFYYPMSLYYTGGANAEVAGLFLALQLAALGVTEAHSQSRRSTLARGVVFLLLAYALGNFHLYAAFPLLSFLLVALLFRRASAPTFIAVVLGMGLSLLSPALLTEAALGRRADWLTWYYNETIPQNLQVTSKSAMDLGYLPAISMGFAKEFGPVTPLFFASGLTLFIDRRSVRLGGFLLAWLTLMLIIAVNAPGSLYFAPYPYWYLFHADRLFKYLAIPLTIFTAAGLMSLLKALQTRSVLWLRKPEAPPLRSRVIPHLLPASLALGLMLAGSLQLISAAGSAFNASQLYSTVSDADLEAMEWIRQNTPQDARFASNFADASDWIHIYTGRRLIPVFANILDPWMSISYMQEVGWHLVGFQTVNPNEPRLYTLYQKYRIDYVYVGAKPAAGRPHPEAQRFTADWYQIAYQADGVTIFQVRR